MGALKLIGAGFALLGLLLVLAPRLPAGRAQPIAYAIRLFLPLWLAMTLAAFVLGQRQEGAVLAQDLLLLLPVFALPALGAGLILYATRTRP